MVKEIDSQPHLIRVKGAIVSFIFSVAIEPTLQDISMALRYFGGRYGFR